MGFINTSVVSELLVNGVWAGINGCEQLKS